MAIVTLLSALLLLTGCKKESKQPVKPSTDAAAAAPEHFEKPIVPRPVALPVVPQAPRPGALAKDASCITAECHADYTRASFIHGPVAQKDCKSCHEDDIGGHKYPLKRTGNDTCTFCHSVAGSQSHQHKAMEQGCNTCHKPHTSQTKFLLTKDNVEQLCLSCHNLPLKKFAHEPFMKGQCTMCHQSHQADNVKLLRGGEGAKHCYTCHDKLQLVMKESSFTHKPAEQDCSTCHNAHTTDFEHQLKAPVEQTCLSCHDKIKKAVEQANLKHAAMTTEQSCANCHSPHASNHRELIRDRMDKTCLTCHDKSIKATDGHTIANMKPVLTQSEFLHGPIRAGSCSGCHDAHGSKHANLLEKDFPKSFYTSFDLKKYDLCFKCHESTMITQKETHSLTNFRDGEKNLHFAHVNRDEKGRSCKSCHALHGSNLPNHMATEVPFEGSKWSMPIGFEKTKDGGTCSPGCHEPKTYKRSESPTTQPLLPPSPSTPGESRGEGSSPTTNPAQDLQQNPRPNPLPEYREGGQTAPTTEIAQPTTRGSS